MHIHAYTVFPRDLEFSWIFRMQYIYIYILADRLLAGARTAILTVQLVTDTWATQLGECHKWPGLAVGCLRTCSRHLWQKALVCSDLPVLGGSWFRCFKSVLAFEGKQGLTWEVVTFASKDMCSCLDLENNATESSCSGRILRCLEWWFGRLQ